MLQDQRPPLPGFGLDAKPAMPLLFCRSYARPTVRWHADDLSTAVFRRSNIVSDREPTMVRSSRVAISRHVSDWNCVRGARQKKKRDRW